MKKTTTKNDVQVVAQTLIELNGETTTLEVKNELRANDFWATQQIVSTFMQDLKNEGVIDWRHNGDYRIYFKSLCDAQAMDDLRALTILNAMNDEDHAHDQAVNAMVTDLYGLNDQFIVDVDWVCDEEELDEALEVLQNYNLEIEVTGNTSANLTGTRENLKKYLANIHYGEITLEELEEFHPELFSTVDDEPCALANSQYRLEDDIDDTDDKDAGITYPEKGDYVCFGHPVKFPDEEERYYDAVMTKNQAKAAYSRYTGVPYPDVRIRILKADMF